MAQVSNPVVAKSAADDGPQFECAWYVKQKPVWDMLRTLLAGTTAMREAGQAYLPKYEQESMPNWNVRLERAVLLNYYKRTVLGLVGKPFGKPLTIPESMPPQLKDEIFKDIDHQGTDLDTFARNVFKLGLGKGLVHILVDMPVAAPAPDGKVKTLADEREENLTPYMVVIEPEDLIAAFAEYVNGVEKLVHVRIRECSVEKEGWKEKTIERIRVLEPGRWELWRKNEKGDYEKEDEGTTSLDYIPLVTWYAEREQFMVSRPPLIDLAHLNIAHWQSASDQRNVLSVARFPILGASGVDPESKLEIGPNSYFAIRDPQGKLYYVEHGGSAISAGRQDLEDLKTEMAMMGLQLLMPQQSGGQTATAKALDSAEANCGLQALVLDFQAVINKAVDMMKDWLGITDVEPDQEAASMQAPAFKPKAKPAAEEDTEEPTDEEAEEDTEEPTDEEADEPPKAKTEAKANDLILINSEFGLSLGQAQDLTALLAMRQGKEISHEAFLAEVKRRGFLPMDFDVQADKDLLDEEKASAPPIEGMPFGGRPQFGFRRGGFGGGGRKPPFGGKEDDAPGEDGGNVKAGA